MTRERLPIGIQTVRKICEDDCYSVDKTAFALRRIEDRHLRYPHNLDGGAPGTRSAGFPAGFARRGSRPPARDLRRWSQGDRP